MSTQFIASTHTDYITYLAGDLQIPCDYGEWDWCCKGEAKWALVVICTACLFSALRLAGDGCKDFLTTTNELMECPKCGDVQTARYFIHQVEAL